MSRLSSEEGLSDLVIGKNHHSRAVSLKSFHALDLAEYHDKTTQELENCLRNSRDRSKVRFLAASIVQSYGVTKGYLCVYGYKPRQLFSLVDQELLEEMASTLADVLFPYFEGGDIIEDHTQVAFGVFRQLQDPLKRASIALSHLQNTSMQSSFTSSIMMHDFESELKMLNHVLEHALGVALIAVESVKDTDHLVYQSPKDFHAYIHQTAKELAEAFHMQPPKQSCFSTTSYQEKICHLPAATWLSMYSAFHTASQQECNSVEIQLTFPENKQQHFCKRSLSGIVGIDDEDDYPLSYSPPDVTSEVIVLILTFANPELRRQQEQAREQDWRHLMPALLQQVGGITTTTSPNEINQSFTITVPLSYSKQEQKTSRDFLESVAVTPVAVCHC